MQKLDLIMIFEIRRSTKYNIWRTCLLVAGVSGVP